MSLVPVAFEKQIGQAIVVGPGLKPGIGENRLDFGSGQKGIARLAIMQRPDAHDVPSQDKLLLRPVEDGDGKVAFNFPCEGFSEVQVSGEGQGCVGRGGLVAQASGRQLLA